MHLNCTLSEDEIGFISLHFCLALERCGNLKGHLLLHVAIFSHANTAISKILLSKVQEEFGDKMYIEGIYSIAQWNERICHETKLILTTSDVHPKTDVPTITIHPLLSNEDIRQISSEISHIEYKESVQPLLSLFSKDLFFAGVNARSADEVIKKVTDQLLRKKFVGREFEELVYRREKLSSTVIQGGIALPHPISFCGRQSSVCPVLFSKPIDWYGRKASIAFFLILKEEDRNNMQHLYDFLLDMSEDKERLTMLLKVRDYDEFVEFMSKPGTHV